MKLGIEVFRHLHGIPRVHSRVVIRPLPLAFAAGAHCNHVVFLGDRDWRGGYKFFFLRFIGYFQAASRIDGDCFVIVPACNFDFAEVNVDDYLATRRAGEVALDDFFAGGGRQPGSSEER
jgi:hypothetical protein